MSIQTQINKLFDQWKKVHEEKPGLFKVLNLKLERFLPDGIAGDENAYINAIPKVLYILKESNAKNSEKVDFWFKEQVDKNGTHQTHQITKRIRFMQKMITGSDDLSVIAYMNLNKCGDGSKTEMKKLAAYSLDDKISLLIKEQIHILNPDIIICGGCFNIVNTILGKET